MNRPDAQRTAGAPAARQRGVVLLFSLIALVVLLVAAAALMRSFNTSMFMAGNIAFKRDLQNQGERVIDSVKSQFTGTALAASSRLSDQPTQAYSAQMLPVNARGVPTALLLSDADFQRAWPGGTFVPVDPAGAPHTDVSIRYLIDRLCSGPGSPAILGTANCVVSGAPPSGTSSDNLLNAAQGSSINAGAAQLAVVYRISLRVSGPRNTVAFFQSTIAAP